MGLEDSTNERVDEMAFLSGRGEKSRKTETSKEDLEFFMKLMKLTGKRATLLLVNFIRKHLMGTHLIFVVGETGSGKTTLLSEITNQELGIGSGSNSGTIGHQVIPAIVHGKQYIFVDTPGFGASDLSDKNVYDDIMGCLYALGPWVKTVGVLFVHSMRQIRLSEGEARTIRWLQCFCGPQFFENITIVLTQWDAIIKQEREQAYKIGEELKRGVFKPILHPSNGIEGGRVYNHGLQPGTTPPDLKFLSRYDDPEGRKMMAANFVNDYYGHVGDPPKLQAKAELDLGWTLYEIQAAQCLFSPSQSALTIVVLRKKTMVLDLDDELQRKDEPPKKFKSLEYDSDQPQSIFKWLEVAKEVAWLFFESSKGMKNFLNLGSHTVEQMNRVRQWWSGESPPE